MMPEITRRKFVQLATGSAVASCMGNMVAQQPPAPEEPLWTPSDPPNTPIGQAKGIFPGRVTWVRDVRATPWDGKTGKWWEEKNINQEVLDRMFSRSLCALTGTTTDKSAWEGLFRYFNRTHARGDQGYRPGEKIAVKINVNNAYAGYHDADNNIDASTHAVRALLRQLTGPGGVPQRDITICDPSPNGNRRAISDRIYLPLHAEFPEVHWVDCQGKFGREAPAWVEGAITYSSPETKLGSGLARCVVEAAYLINFALLKGHEISGVTLCAKNHFGSIRFPWLDHEKYVAPRNRPMDAQNGLVDLMGSPNLGGKTMLYIIDGLYGTQTNVGNVTERDRWRRTFNGEWSASYFMSQDPVAIDSVGLDFLRAEFQGDLGFSGAKQFPKGSIKNCDNYLHEAARGSNAAFGPYKPNGVTVGSLGVHEHWNNPVDRKYSRNMSPGGKGIELFTVTG
jgi:Domain of unknown function (DUF362)